MDTYISEGDIVLFLKSDSPFDPQYQYGIILSTIPGKDGKIRKVKVGYLLTRMLEGVRQGVFVIWLSSIQWMKSASVLNSWPMHLIHAIIRFIRLS